MSLLIFNYRTWEVSSPNIFIKLNKGWFSENLFIKIDFPVVEIFI